MWDAGGDRRGEERGGASDGETRRNLATRGSFGFLTRFFNAARYLRRLRTIPRRCVSACGTSSCVVCFRLY